MNEYLALLLGVICAGIGGELFVRGTVGLASLARISPGIIGATVAAFATSSPELSVSISSALAGEPQIALGDALGSNVVNIALILGLALVISGIHSPRDSVKRDLPVALLIPIMTGLLFLDGELSRSNGILMLCLFIAWLAAAVIEAKRQRSFTEDVLGEGKTWLVVISFVAGLVFLIAAGKLIVTGAQEIAISFGIDEFIIGATIVAIGTSVPELATTLISKLRGHDEVGLGTVLGSNIYNGIFIVSVAAIIHPITVPLREVVVTLVFGVMALTFVYPPRNGFMGRWRGILLLALYAAYATTVLLGGAA
ncbi:calcium/sodium antiporter [Methylobacter luteus]|uniref:calcium/sodium antiporter n=1 Tax=Methylobacter luteus TaxID=415 RepID=UPI000405861E|nr:calcium/sodium antiporter [Methylobacter luteus]